jgi:hypothetical protein
MNQRYFNAPTTGKAIRHNSAAVVAWPIELSTFFLCNVAEDWVSTYRNFDHAHANTTSAIEGYHGSIKGLMRDDIWRLQSQQAE